MNPRLHQFVPTLDPGAVGTHILEAQRSLRVAGYESEVFAEHTKPPYETAARLFTEYGKSYPAQDDDVLIYHAAIGSSVADWLMARRPARLVVDYHNITPPEWFEGWEPGLSHGLAWGRAQLAKLARGSRTGLADSAFNAEELRRFGFRHTEVLPILCDVDELAASLDEDAAGRLIAGKTGADWLFVGRLAPNKCQQDLVKAFALYHRVYDAGARLWLVGANSSDGYAAAVQQFAADAGVGAAVHLTGPVTTGELAAHYRTADMFVCVSEHEGFLVPLLEAWRHQLPVIAYAAAAVPETMGQGGLALSDKSPATVAAAVHRVLSDGALTAELAAAGRQRLEQFSLARTRERLRELAEALVSGRRR